MQYLDIYSPTSVATAAIVILLSVVYHFIRNRSILPGPRGLPYFGLYPFLNYDTCHLQLEEYGKKYGDLYSFTSFESLIINLGSAKAIKEVHVNKSDCFAARFERFNVLVYLLEGSLFLEKGESWKVQRKFFIQAIKEYGMAAMREDTAGPIFDTISATIEYLKSRKGVSFNVIELLTDRCTVTMRKVLFGEDDGISDEKIREMNHSFAIALDGSAGLKMLMLGPVGKFLFKTLPQYRIALDQLSVMTKLLMDAVKTIESNMDENHPTCVVEEYYREKRIRHQKNDPTWKYFTDKFLVASLMQIYGDGVLSVAYFIGCFLQALVEHPEEQDKIYQELSEVVGPSRLPTPDDRRNLPYTNAFMTEVMRMANFLSIFPSMECTKETTIRGYRIPKGSITMLNIWQAHHDPKVYKNPYKFDPSRYIPDDGKPKPESNVEFGLGKRACTGEPFVMLQAFLFLTSIVNNFTISVPERELKSAIFLTTGDMELTIVPRKEK